MGIPLLWTWLQRKFPSAVRIMSASAMDNTNQHVNGSQPLPLPCHISAEFVAVDVMCDLHKIINKTQAISASTAARKCIERIRARLQWLAGVRTLVVAMDGVAPRGKVFQQWQRREKIIAKPIKVRIMYLDDRCTVMPPHPVCILVVHRACTTALNSLLAASSWMM